MDRVAFAGGRFAFKGGRAKLQADGGYRHRG